MANLHWQLLADDQVLIGSEDSDERLDQELPRLAGVPLVSFTRVPLPHCADRAGY